MIVSMSRDLLLDWNGADLPDKLRELPAGRYVIAPVDDVSEISDDEDAGLEAALRSIDAGRVESHEVVLTRADEILKR